MRLTYYHFSNRLTPIRTTEIINGPGLYEFPEDLKFGDKEIVIAVDPGTTAVGITIGEFGSPVFRTIITLKRSNIVYEDSADKFSNTFNNIFLKDFLKYNNVKRVIVESQYLDPRRGSHTFKVLSGFVRGFRAVVTGFGLKPEEVAPATWKSTFFKGYSLRDTIDLRESNKNHIVNRARELVPFLQQFPNGDGYDSFGIMFHYYKTMHRPKGEKTILPVTTNMTKDYRSNIHLLIGILNKTMTEEELNTLVGNHIKFFKGRRRFYQFIPHDKLSAEENIRALMNENPHIYLGVTKPYAKLFPELLNQRDNIGGPIDEDDIIYIMGYRERL